MTVLLALSAAACGGTGDAADPTADPSEVATEAERETATDEATDSAETTEGGATATEPVIEDGRHATLLVAVEPSARTVTFDVIQFFRGDEATAAYREDVPEDPDGYPENDYWVRNVSSRLRTLPIAPDVTVMVLRPGGPDELASTLEELALLPSYAENRVGSNPFWLTVEDGVVIAIDEQYTP